MEDTGIAILEALSMWNDSVQEGVIEGERGNGSQEPTVPWDGRVTSGCCPELLLVGHMRTHAGENPGIPGK